MPNFHPQLVALVAPLLEPGEEVWAVYAAKRRALIATERRLFLVGSDGLVAHHLREFRLMRRPRPSLVLLERRSGGHLSIHLDPLDEHGIQALTVIGLLVASVDRSDTRILERPAPARVAPSVRRRRPIAHRHILPAHRPPALRTDGCWSLGWGEVDTPPRVQAITPAARHGYRLAARS